MDNTPENNNPQEQNPAPAAPAAEDEAPMTKTQGRITGFFVMLLTALWAFMLLVYFGSIGIDTLTGYVATQIVTPHMLCVVVAAIFSCIAFFGKKRWAMLTAAILLVASIVLFPSYAYMVIIQAVLAFISYARMGRTVIVEEE